MIKLFTFCILSLWAYSLVSAQSLPKGRQEDPYSEQIWNSEALSTQEIAFQHTTSEGRQGGIEKTDVFLGKDAKFAEVTKYEPAEGKTDVQVKTSPQERRNELDDGNTDFFFNDLGKSIISKLCEDDNGSSKKSSSMQRKSNHELKDGYTNFDHNVKQRPFRNKTKQNGNKEEPTKKPNELELQTRQEKSEALEAQGDNRTSLIYSLTRRLAVGSVDSHHTSFVKERFNGYKKTFVLPIVKHWLSRRFGYFDSLASSIFRK